MDKIRENLGNLEGCIAHLKDQNNLIELLINKCFYKTGFGSEKDILRMRLEYQMYQSLIFTISECLRNLEKDLETNVYALYDIAKGE